MLFGKLSKGKSKKRTVSSEYLKPEFLVFSWYFLWIISHFLDYSGSGLRNRLPRLPGVILPGRAPWYFSGNNLRPPLPTLTHHLHDTRQ